MGKNELTANDLTWILPLDYLKLNKWSRLTNIPNRYKEAEYNERASGISFIE